MEQEKVWDKVASPWKGFRKQKFPQIDEFLEGKKGKILDLGCGAGRNFSKQEGLEFYGVDFSSEMIKFAGEYAEEIGVDVELKVGEVNDIPYSDGFFGYVIYNAVLHCVETPEKRRKSLEEVFRVLKKNGEAIITVWSRNQKRVKNKPKESYIPWGVGGEKVMRYYYLYEKDELEDLIKNVGFEIVKIWEDYNINVIVRKA